MKYVGPCIGCNKDVPLYIGKYCKPCRNKRNTEQEKRKREGKQTINPSGSVRVPRPKVHKGPCLTCGGVIKEPKHHYCESCHAQVKDRYFTDKVSPYRYGKSGRYSGPCLMCLNPENTLRFGRRYCWPCVRMLRTKEFSYIVGVRKRDGKCMDCGSADLADSQRCFECKRAVRLYKTYGISEEEYQQKRSAQQNKCAICLKEEKDCLLKIGQKERFVVDHDHKTNKVRDLICGKCNSVLGYAEDNSEILLSAARYLALHGFQDNSLAALI